RYRRSLVQLPLFDFFFLCSAAPRDLHSFPTRRSSDLLLIVPGQSAINDIGRAGEIAGVLRCQEGRKTRYVFWLAKSTERDLADRSEEHTSELQSRENLVCRLLLEKKKKDLNRTPIDFW